jgi:hypothetical protein
MMHTRQLSKGTIMKTILGVGLLAAATLLAGSAMARTYNVDESPSRYIACYNKVYVPAVVQVNTRGRLVRAPSNAWEVAGDKWDYVRNPGVYIQTRRTVEPDHYTLVSSGCP